MKKKIIGALLAATMIVSSLSGVSAAETGYQVNEELAAASGEVVLDVVGPAIFENGETETIDLVSGITKPGYEKIVERWNELYPNVTLNINVCPWDSWRNYLTTTCLEGNADVLLHGGLMSDLALDLTSYVEAEPEYREQIFTTVTLRDTDDLTKAKVSGISVAVNPVVVWVDTEKFENFGVELPADDWTIADMLECAQKLTGTDPVTGEESYGIQIPWSEGANVLNSHWMISEIYGAEIFQYESALKDCTVNYTCEESIKAFEMIAELAKCEAPATKEAATVPVLDGTNNWAITATSQPFTGYYEMANAGLEGRYKAYNYPVVEVGEYAGMTAPAFFDGNMAIYKDSDSKEWAWEFIKFMTTDEVAVQWIIDTLRHPNNLEGNAKIAETMDERIVEVMKNALASVGAQEYISNSSAVYNNISFGATTANLQTAVEDVINERKTPEEAAEFMQSTIEEYVDSVS